jgi:glycine dehydrogenase
MASLGPAVRKRLAASTSRISRSSLPTAARRGLATAKPPASLFAALDTFPDRHIGPDDAEASRMLALLGYDSMDAFIHDTVPQQVKIAASEMTDDVIPPLSELELNRRAKALGRENKPFRSYIGMGYHNAVVPPVILRNVRNSLVTGRAPRLTYAILCAGYGESGLVYPIHAVSG